MVCDRWLSVRVMKRWMECIVDVVVIMKQEVVEEEVLEVEAEDASDGECIGWRLE